MSQAWGITPLFVAAEKGHTALVGQLLTAGADVDATNVSALGGGGVAVLACTFWGHAHAGTALCHLTPLYLVAVGTWRESLAVC
jgi:hypothetical protein